jgi:hypothetical protein
MQGPLNTLWFAAPVLLAAIGALLVLAGIVHVFRGRVFGGGGRLLVGCLFAVSGAAVGLFGLNLQTYSRLTYESPVAEIEVKANDPAAKRYTVTIRRLDGTDVTQSCELQGDEWLLSGRVQKWKPWVNVLGIDSTYTLDQMANKYADALEANGKPITACAIEKPAPEANRYVPPQWLDWVMAHAQAEDRRFGSASYMPLAHGALYEVIMTQSGLNAEPANDAARAANAARP